jgi:hypothetical protein
VVEDRRLDGNAIGGVLRDVFGAELTAAPGTCAHCGAREQLASTDVYVDAPGIVVRCRHCEGVLLRIVRGPERVWLDLSGLGSIEIHG